MESPVETTYELRSHSLLPVGPRMTDKADSCGELSTAVITGKTGQYNASKSVLCIESCSLLVPVDFLQEILVSKMTC